MVKHDRSDAAWRCSWDCGFKDGDLKVSIGVFYGLEFIGSFLSAPIGAFLAGVVRYSNVFYFTTVLVLSVFTVTLPQKASEKSKQIQGYRPICLLDRRF